MKTFLSWCKEQAPEVYKDVSYAQLLDEMKGCKSMWEEDEAININGELYSPDIASWDYDSILHVVNYSDYMIFYEENYAQNIVLFSTKNFCEAMSNSVSAPRLWELGIDGTPIEQPYNASTYFDLFHKTRRTALDLSEWDFSDIECLDSCFTSPSLQIVNLGDLTKERFPKLKSAYNAFGPNVQHREMMQEHLNALCK